MDAVLAALSSGWGVGGVTGARRMGWGMEGGGEGTRQRRMSRHPRDRGQGRGRMRR